MTSSDSAPVGNRSPNIQRLPGRSGPVCVLGLGLIGGSLLRDLSAAGITAFGWNRSAATVNAAASDGFDVSTDLVATLARAEACNALIVLGVPVPALPSLLSAIGTHAPTCGFTDVTSVKGEVARLVDEHGLAPRFVGGHPMAGTANSGWDATMEGLFVDAVWVVATDGAPHKPDQTPNITWLEIWCRVIAMATQVGAIVVPARALDHDHAVARISHLPHILAETMAITADQGGALALSLAASSFRDATRVAGTEPELVRAMCENNREALVIALDEAMDLLATARTNLADPLLAISDLVEAGHTARLHYEDHAGRVRNTPHRAAPRQSTILLRLETNDWLDQLHYAEATGSPIAICNE